MLQFNGLAGLPSYLQRSCYIPKHLGKPSSKPTKLKMQIFLRLSINAHKSKASLYSMGCTACKQTCWMFAVIFYTETSCHANYSVSSQR